MTSPAAPAPVPAAPGDATATATDATYLDPAELADAFFTVAHALKRTVNARFQHTALSVARLRVLFSLATLGPQRMGELSTCVDVAARTMTSTVEAMERDGLVRRAPDPGDGRATMVHLTEAGMHAYGEGRRVQAAAVADVFAGLDVSERGALGALLDSLARGIPGHEGDALVASASGSTASPPPPA